MTSRKVDMTIPNVPRPTASRGLVLGANGKIADSSIPEDVVREDELSIGLGDKVDKDSIVVAATRLVQSKLAGADTQPAFKVTGDGKLAWGPGAATATDTTLYRAGAGKLQTDGQMISGTELVANTDVWARYGQPQQVIMGIVGVYPGLLFGPDQDTDLYRFGPDLLRTDDVFRAYHLRSEYHVVVDLNDGGGKLLFGSANDTNLYRSGANTLKTDGSLEVAGVGQFDSRMLVNYGLPTAQSLYLGQNQGTVGVAAITLGGDTNLYRAAAGQLRTDTLFMAGGEIGAQAGNAAATWIGGQGPGGASGVKFGNAGDTNLYRLAVGVLKTDGQFRTANEILGPVGPSNESGLRLGGDMNLYRSAAGRLRTDGTFETVGGIVMDTDQSGDKLFFGGAGDTALFRGGPAQLNMTGSLVGASYIAAQWNGSAWGFQGGVPGNGITLGGDTTLYRSAANVLQTDGSFNCKVLGLTNMGHAFALDGNLIGAPNPGWAPINSIRVWIDGTQYKIPIYEIGP